MAGTVVAVGKLLVLCYVASRCEVGTEPEVRRPQRGQLSMGGAREYFAMFDREEMLDGLLDEIAG